MVYLNKLLSNINCMEKKKKYDTNEKYFPSFETSPGAPNVST
jgi:hypothetical protein